MIKYMLVALAIYSAYFYFYNLKDDTTTQKSIYNYIERIKHGSTNNDPDKHSIYSLSSHDEFVSDIYKTIDIVDRKNIFKPNVTSIKKEYKLKPKLKVFKLNYAKADDVYNNLKVYLDNHSSVVSDKRLNAIIVDENLCDISYIKELINNLDTPIDQILIDARVVIINKEASLSLDNTLKTSVELPGIKLSTEKYSLVSTKAHELGLNISGLNTILDLELKSLESEGQAKLISSPKLMTANKQSAYIQSGEEIPYEEYRKNGGTTVMFKKAVLGLKVTPEIISDNMVLLDITLNQDARGREGIKGRPAISTQEVQTTILSKDGQTVSIGGIFKQDVSNSSARHPFLHKLPLFGSLFKSSKTQELEQEVVMYVTPKIVKINTNNNL